MFENNLIKNIHKSRYIASWCNIGGSLEGKWRWQFRDWLRSLVIDGEHLTEDEVMSIYYYATNGKMELESNARLFLIRQKES